jgi:hypothetical protein
MIEDVKKLQSKLEGTFAQEITNSDQKAMELWKTNPENARKYLNEITEDRANSTVASWNKLFEYLLVKYIDGNIKREENGQFKRNAYGFPVGPMQPGYNDTWKKQVIESNGDVLLVK